MGGASPRTFDERGARAPAGPPGGDAPGSVHSPVLFICDLSFVICQLTFASYAACARRLSVCPSLFVLPSVICHLASFTIIPLCYICYLSSVACPFLICSIHLPSVSLPSTVCPLPNSYLPVNAVSSVICPSVPCCLSFGGTLCIYYLSHIHLTCTVCHISI